ncbi:uncharacterized protein L201_008002 [Kwoniella dendrophila CBS 6074]|uniref:Solute carrier family 40 protein n=1 Tax=Kwoniella dendrophila CBS 6074 TaxID=1295534 RepID=A0AAX4K7B7_9TREE
MVKIEQPAPLQYLFEGQIEDGISGGISQESSKRNSMIFNDSADDQDIAADNNGSEIPNTETHISNPNNVILNTERQLPSLPNVDNSKEAWFYVIASFVEEMLLWGPLLSTGVYLKYYSASPIFDSATEPQIALIGTIAPFFAYASGMPLL